MGSLGLSEFMEAKSFTGMDQPTSLFDTMHRAPIDFWQNSTPHFGAAAFCTMKMGKFRRQT